MSEPLLISFLGDDFTGSTDAMESLTLAGAKTVLFLEPPDAAQLARFPGVRAVGVASVARSMTPAEMDRELPPLLAKLKALGAPLVQYKVCSTFDSSPHVGSIGRVIDIGRAIFPDAPFVPIVAGAPALGRYCIFGNLFATSGVDPQPHRLDRHPSMSRHPITPATESDLRVQLSRQTHKRVALFDLTKLEQSADDARHSLHVLLSEKPDAVLFDVLHEAHLASIGRLVADFASEQRPLFAVGSSGFTAAVGSNWVRTGVTVRPAGFSDPGPAQPLLVASGSRSTVTHAQIEWAVSHGFTGIPLDVAALATGVHAEGALRRATDAVVENLSVGRHAIIYTSARDDDPLVVGATARLIGEALGVVVKAAVVRSRIRRVLIAGGDTSGYLARTLGIEALEMIAPLTPGAPLCRAYAPPGSPVDGLELNFKGGQVGRPDYFGAVARGRM